MSLNAIMNNALSGLMTNQSVLRQISDNVSNVNTPNYARRIYQTQTGVSAGVGEGVSLGNVTRAVDAYVNGAMLNANGDTARLETINTSLQSLQGSLYRPDDEGSLSARVDDVLTSLSRLGVDPTSLASKRDALTSATNFSSEISRITGELTDLRSSAEQNVGSTVDEINTLLGRLESLNADYRRQSSLGNSTLSIEDQRASALSDLSQLIDVRTTTQPDGSVYVSTQNGVSLLSAVRYQLNYSAQVPVTSSTLFKQITISPVDPTTGVASGSARPLDPAISGGKLKGYLELRDSVLPQMQDQLGELAMGADSLNAASNSVSPVPPPTTLTGRQTGLLGSDVYNTSGATQTLNVAIVDANGAAVGGVRTVSITAGMTVSGMITAINGALGTDGTASFTNGVLSITSNVSGAGVVVQDGSPAASRAGRGFSHFFGLNDIFQSSTPLHFDTGLTSATVGNFTSGTIRLEIRGPSNEVYQSINYTPSASDDFGTIITALNTQAGGYMTFSLNSAGALVATPAANYSKATVGVVSDTTTRGGASGISFTALFGVGDRYRIDAAANMAVAPGLANTPSRLPTAALSLTGTPNLAPSDGTGAKAYQALQTSTQQFGAAGNVPAIAATLGQYAAALLTASGQAAKDTASSLTDKQALKTELSGRQSSVSGVNTDEELSNMVVYQQAYNACARLITTTKEMFDTLLSIAK